MKMPGGKYIIADSLKQTLLIDGMEAWGAVRVYYLDKYKETYTVTIASELEVGNW